MRRVVWLAAMAAAGVIGAATARAEPPAPRAPVELGAQLESLLGPRALLGGVVTEQDLDLLLAHLRASILAAARGEEAPSSQALEQRAAGIADALRARGALAALLMLEALEARAREHLPVPPPESRPLPPPVSPNKEIRL